MKKGKGGQLQIIWEGPQDWDGRSATQIGSGNVRSERLTVPDLEASCWRNQKRAHCLSLFCATVTESHSQGNFTTIVHLAHMILEGGKSKTLRLSLERAFMLH